MKKMFLIQKQYYKLILNILLWKGKEIDVMVSQQDSQQISDRISSTNSDKLSNLTNFDHGRVDYNEFTNNLEAFLNGK